MEKGEAKKIVAFVIVLIVVFCAGGAVTILGVGVNVESGQEVTVQNSTGTGSVNAVSGSYQLEVSSDTQWVAYIVADGHNIQKAGDGNQTIDLGEVNHYASITIDQTGIGTTYVNLINGDGKVIDSDNTNQAETNALFLYLRMANNGNS